MIGGSREEERGGGRRSAWDGVIQGTTPFDRADQLHAFWALHLHLVNVLVTEGHDVFPILESLRDVLLFFTAPNVTTRPNDLDTRLHALDI